MRDQSKKHISYFPEVLSDFVGAIFEKKNSLYEDLGPDEAPSKTAFLQNILTYATKDIQGQEVAHLKALDMKIHIHATNTIKK